MTSERGDLMKSAVYLPPQFFENSVVLNDIYESVGIELDLTRTALDETLDQSFVATATWGLDTYERELGLPPAPTEVTTEDRRSRILGMGFRRSQTATRKAVSQVASAWEYGEIVVYDDPRTYTVFVSFISPGGIPADIEALQAELRRMIPAHLGIEYVFNFYTWGELRGSGDTWLDVKTNHTWGSLKVAP
jgi:hypothetical protein